MCRMLGVMSASPRSFELLLSAAPHSIATLSKVHSDGWGVALDHDGLGWRVQRGVLRAEADRNFYRVATDAVGEVMIAHIRQKTLGATSLENTHPFVSMSWAFAHNGTVTDLDYLTDHSSPERLAEVRGETDSERLLAFLLTRLDEASATQERTGDRIDRTLRRATLDLARHAGIGTVSFLLSNGHVLYAHRLGAPLYLLERPPFCTQCSGSTPCVAVTSEPITDEPWMSLENGELLRIARKPTPHWTRIKLA